MSSKRMRVFAGPNGSGKSFTYETVMSHPGKLDFFQKAIDADYKCIYILFQLMTQK